MDALGKGARGSAGPHSRADAEDICGGELLWTSRPTRSMRTSDWSVPPLVPNRGAGGHLSQLVVIPPHRKSQTQHQLRCFSHNKHPQTLFQKDNQFAKASLKPCLRQFCLALKHLVNTLNCNRMHQFFLIGKWPMNKYMILF